MTMEGGLMPRLSVGLTSPAFLTALAHRQQNVFIASRCPDMLLADLIVMTPVVLANGINLLHMYVQKSHN
jgi:hypothetical protein